jgi:hypothetical protein
VRNVQGLLLGTGGPADRNVDTSRLSSSEQSEIPAPSFPGAGSGWLALPIRLVGGTRERMFAKALRAMFGSTFH